MVTTHQQLQQQLQLQQHQHQQHQQHQHQPQQQPQIPANVQLTLQSITSGSPQIPNQTAITPVINTPFMNGTVAMNTLTNQTYINGTSNHMNINISQSSDINKSGNTNGNITQNTTINQLLALLVSRR
jgi:hypothetical protein